MGASANLVTHTAWTAAEERRDLTHHHDFGVRRRQGASRLIFPDVASLMTQLGLT
jgi:hypothetical protein